ncbi:MAG: DUF3617 domain-containing protein [Polaromonas sp.]|nr:MAG: DUF3617 domain-containing protein [Polaromonas sp.]
MAATAVTGTSVQAQTMKPGLWETTTKMGGSPEMDKAMAQMQEQLASMPADQRKKMQEMMGKSGLNMDAAPGGGMSVKACITKEMVDRNQMPTQQKGDCTTTISDKNATSMKMSFTCTNPPSSGEGQWTFSGDTAYSMKMRVKSIVEGKPQNTTLDGGGKWLSADCGNVRPVVIPKN